MVEEEGGIHGWRVVVVVRRCVGCGYSAERGSWVEMMPLASCAALCLFEVDDWKLVGKT